MTDPTWGGIDRLVNKACGPSTVIDRCTEPFQRACAQAHPLRIDGRPE